MQEYGPIYKSFGGSRPFVFVESPELVRQVLLTNTYRPVFPSIWLGKEREFDKANILVGFTHLYIFRSNTVTSTALYDASLDHVNGRGHQNVGVQAVRGEKHRSLRGAWTPMFFSGNTPQQQGIASCQHHCRRSAYAQR